MLIRSRKSVFKDPFRIGWIFVANVSAVGAVIIVGLAFGAGIEGRRVGLFERAMPNLNGDWTTTTWAAIGIRSAIDPQHAACNALVPRMDRVIGSVGRHC